MRQLSNNARVALSESQDKSLTETRMKLEAALARITTNSPKIVALGAKLNVSNVAKEANVDRATVYRFHKDILFKILDCKSVPSEEISHSRTPLPVTQEEKNKTYRALIEEAQQQVVSLARINYRLTIQNEELNELLASKSRELEQLKLSIGIGNLTVLGRSGK